MWHANHWREQHWAPWHWWGGVVPAVQLAVAIIKVPMLLVVGVSLIVLTAAAETLPVRSVTSAVTTMRLRRIES
jgi:hypothetical protein